MARRRRGLRFKTETMRPKGEKPYFVVTEYAGRRAVGHMELEPTKHGKHHVMKVAYSEVAKPGMGYGTPMYEFAARFSCSKGMPLGSDKLRTSASNGFWEKQAKKGRATCAVRSGGVRLSQEFYAKGRWSCGGFVLSCPAPRSLAGLKKRRR